MGKDLISAAGLIKIIDESRQNALKKVNEELINMYWKVGEFLSRESEQAAFGDAYIDGIADSGHVYYQMVGQQLGDIKKDNLCMILSQDEFYVHQKELQSKKLFLTEQL